jgi:hypothetical protein
VWTSLTQTLEGNLVILEPRQAQHEAPLAEVSQHPEIWQWVTTGEQSAQWFGGDPGGVRDFAYYGVIEKDWPRVRANLEKRLQRARRQARPVR